MAEITRSQQKIINEIKNNLGIDYNGDNTRKSASKFIDEFAESNKKFKENDKKRIPPTPRQIKLVKKMSERLGIECKAKTVKTMAKWIDKYYTEYIGKDTSIKGEGLLSKIQEMENQKHGSSE